MITAQNLSKRYGSTLAVDNVSFTIRAGQVTGFLGPNGAGKSTTMRMILGLDRPTAGTVLVDGARYAESAAPMSLIGSLLDAKALNHLRSARNHLRMIAATHGIPDSRVDEVLALTGLTEVADKRVKGFSLGMHQRLGIAGALLGNPRALVLDEPVNGLDPEGVHWVRTFVRDQAAQGRAILLSSHLMSEMAQVADHIIVLGRGRVIADAPVSEFLHSGDMPRVRMRVSDASALATAVAPDAIAITMIDAHTVEVEGLDAPRIVRDAVSAGLDVFECTPQTTSLEDAYLALTGDAVEYRSAAPVAA